MKKGLFLTCVLAVVLGITSGALAGASAKQTSRFCVYVDHLNRGASYLDVSTNRKFGHKTCIVGERGAKGATGAAGAGGARGATGPQGPKGDPGTPGLSVPGVVATHVTDTDSAHCGIDWANLDYTRTLQFIPQNDGTIQVLRSYNGTFTTIAGAPKPNPATCPGLPQTGGVTGTITGYDVQVVTGGVFTPNATCPDPCTTAAELATFFPAQGGSVATATVTDGWEYQYDTAANGHWVNRSATRGGDIGNING